jgi:gliding motility-associated lipoprotein GldH
MAIKRYIFLLLPALIFIACSDNRVYDHVESIQEDTWKAGDEINFLVNVSDTLLAYDILIHIRNTNEYEYSNLWMFVETIAPSGAALVDTVEFTLADNSGRWLGKGLGSINSLLFPYKSNIRFPYRGIYEIKLRQAMRSESIQGIKNVGIRIQKH